MDIRPETLVDRCAEGTALCMQTLSPIGARRRDFEAVLVLHAFLGFDEINIFVFEASLRPETLLDRCAEGTALCMQIFSSIGARRRDFEAVLVLDAFLHFVASWRPPRSLKPC